MLEMVGGKYLHWLSIILETYVKNRADFARDPTDCDKLDFSPTNLTVAWLECF